MDNQHELLAAVKDLALSLGRTPTRAEFEGSVIGGDRKLRKYFGSFSALLQAAGLETYDERRSAKKIDQSIFRKNIETHLEAYTPKARPIRQAKWPKIAVISDIHWPFCNQKVIDTFYQFISEHEPEYVILNGDAWDMYAHAKFPRSHNQFTPRDEQRLAREANEIFWKQVKKLAPSAKLYQMMGNHDIRPMKRVLESYPEAEDWIAEKLKELFTFEGVTTIFDVREELIVGDIAIFHGYRTQLGAHRDFMLLNSVNGHSHRGGCVFRNIREQVLWELNSGYAADAAAKGLTYTPQRIVEWTPGFGWVDEYGPRFIPVV